MSNSKVSELKSDYFHKKEGDFFNKKESYSSFEVNTKKHLNPQGTNLLEETVLNADTTGFR
jgi:hypothetical protein